jgi:hypothetical protein
MYKFKFLFSQNIGEGNDKTIKSLFNLESKNRQNNIMNIVSKVKKKNADLHLCEDNLDATYLNKDQIERLNNIRCLVRNHSKGKLRWDILIMILAIFN